MPRRQIITLLTDFGTSDPYVAAMKGGILSSCPNVNIVDISHDIPPHDTLCAAFVLVEAARQFPPDTLHVVVVDPGVGTQRAILAARCGGMNFLVPDSGLISFAADTLGLEMLHLCTNSMYVPRIVAGTFHGRDIFAPIAATILRGVPLRQLGPQPKQYERFDVPRPQFADGCVTGQVIYTDHFGNLITNIPIDFVNECFIDLRTIKGFCNDKPAGELQGAYGFVSQGAPLLVSNSMNLVEIAVNQGRASDYFGAKKGSPVKLCVR